MLIDKHIDILLSESGVSAQEARESLASSCKDSYPGIAFPYHDLQGNLLGKRIKLDKPFPDGGKYFQGKDKHFNLFFVKSDIPRILDHKTSLIIVEGEKKALALRQSKQNGVVASIPGCWGWSRDKELAPIFSEIPLAGRHVAIIPDSDFLIKVNVWEGYIGLVEKLFSMGATVDLVDISLPSKQKVGVDDFLLAGGCLTGRMEKPLQTFRHIDFAREPGAYNAQDVKIAISSSILLDGIDRISAISEIATRSKYTKSLVEAEFRKARKAFFANRPKTEYETRVIEFDSLRHDQRALYGMLGNRLRVVGGFYEEAVTGNIVKKGNQGLCYFHDGADFAQRLSNIVPFCPGRYDQEGVFKSAGYQILDQSEANGFLKSHQEHTKLKIIRLYTKNPVLVESEGSFKVVNSPGYHEDLGILHDGEEILPSDSTQYLQQAFDYPWATEADKTTAIMAAIGAIFFRAPGEHPIIVAQGNKVNLGKSSYLKSIALIATGRMPGSVDYHPQNHEFSKFLLAQMDEEFVLIDNIRAPIVASQTLERLVTDEVAELRILGTPKKKSRLNTIQFMASLNGGRFSEDLLTRSIPLFLDVKNKAQHRNLIPFVKENRSKILAEMLGMIQRWIDAGSPQKEVKDFDKFPKFGGILNGIAEVNGLVGCLARAGEAKSKLDVIQSAFLEAAYEELDNSGSTQTTKRSVKQVVEWLTEVYGHDLLREHQSTQAKYTSVGQRLSEMSGNTFPFTAFDRTVTLEVVQEECKTTKAGRKNYYVMVHGDTLDSGVYPHDNNPKTKGKTGSNEQKGYTSSNGGTGEIKKIKNNFPFTLAKRGECILNDELNSDSNGLSRDTLDFRVYPSVSSEPDSSWFEPQQGEYKYTFKDFVFESKWWAGEDLGASFSFDIETEVDQHWNIKLASAFNGKILYRLKPEDLKAFVAMHLDREWICHNAVFDIINTMKHVGMEPIEALKMVNEHRIKDTLMLAKLVSLAEGDPFGNDLGSVAKQYLDIDLPKDVGIGEGRNKKKVSLSYGDYTTIAEAPSCYLHYNAYDTIATYFLWNPLHARALALCDEHNVAKEKLLSYHLLVQTSICGGITSSFGMATDQVAVKAKYDELTNQIEGCLVELRQHGYDPAAERVKKKKKGEPGIQDIFCGILDSLEKEHGVVFEKYFHKGRKKWLFSNSDEKLKPFDHIPFISNFLRYTTLQKTKATFIDPLIMADRISSTYRAGMVSGRISSSNPNLQNIPTKGGIRELYVAAPGKKLIIADYSGAELHCAGQFALSSYGHSALATLLNEGVDVHRYVASRYLGIPEDQITKAQRQSGKVMNFGRFGGSGPKTLRDTAQRDYGVDLTLEEVKELITVWDNLFPEVKDHFAAANDALCKAWGVSKSEADVIRNVAKGNLSRISSDEIDWAWGHISKITTRYAKLKKWSLDAQHRRPSLDLARGLEMVRVSVVDMSGRVRGGCTYTEWCNNAALQGRQADITNIAWAYLLQAGFVVVNVIHDEFLVEVDVDKAAEAQKEVEEIMLRAASEYNPSMTAMSVESSIQDHWTK